MRIRPKYILLCFAVFVAFFLTNNCSSNSHASIENPLEHNLQLAGSNRPELEKVLAHYREHPEDSLRLKAAIALISNMEWHHYYDGAWLQQFNGIFNQTANKNDEEIAAIKDSILSVIGLNKNGQLTKVNDISVISADYMISNIDQAFAAWQASPRCDSISFSTFCNFILPYKNLDEPTEDWRDTLQQRYGWVLKDPVAGSDPAEVMCKVNEDFKQWFRYSAPMEDYPGRISLSNLLKGQRGTCSDMAALAIYTGRALGIPIAMDFTPQWGNHDLGHVWNTLILNDHDFVPFLGAESSPGEYTSVQEGEGKPSKIYRRTLLKQEDSFGEMALEAGLSLNTLPENIANPRMKDVTRYYTMTSNVAIQTKEPSGKAVYLCLFGKGTWSAIAGAIVGKDHKAIFKDMGRDILYLPMTYHKGKYKPIGNPFILTFDGEIREIELNNKTKQTLRISRYYPLKRAETNWDLANCLNNARFEGANSPDFSDATLLYTIDYDMNKIDLPKQQDGIRYRDRLEYETLWQGASVKSKVKFRYVRLIFAEDKPMRLGDLAFYTSDSETPLPGNAIGTAAHPEWAFDSEEGFSINQSKAMPEQWVGLDLGSQQQIDKIRFIPANDEHRVMPGNIYQLSYWDHKWKIVDAQKADQLFLEFKNVPTNGIYWLRCITCDQWVERPFTFENGKQIWW